MIKLTEDITEVGESEEKFIQNQNKEKRRELAYKRVKREVYPPNIKKILFKGRCMEVLRDIPPKPKPKSCTFHIREKHYKRKVRIHSTTK